MVTDPSSDVSLEATIVDVVDEAVVAIPEGLNVPPELPPDAPPEAATVGGSVPLDPPSVVSPETAAVGVVDVVAVPGMVGGDVPLDTSEDVDGVGTIVPADSPEGGSVGSNNAMGDAVPADSSDDTCGVGNDDAPAIGEVVDPVTKVVSGLGAGEESSFRGYVLFNISTTIASVASMKPSVSVIPSLPLMTSSAVTPHSEL